MYSGEKVAEKIQVSLWLRKDLKHIVDNEDLNLTKFVNDALEAYFSVSNVEKINERLAAARETVVILEKRRADFLAEGTDEERVEKSKEGSWKFLETAYRERIKIMGPDEFDKGWLDSRGFEKDVKMIGLPLNEILIELRRRTK